MIYKSSHFKYCKKKHTTYKHRCNKKKDRMRILLIGQSLGTKKDLSCEGLQTIVRRLKEHLNKENEVYINETTRIKDADIINIHSSGFSEKKYPKAIYSIHANIKPQFLKSLYDAWQFYTKIYDWKNDYLKTRMRIKKIILSLTSQLVPIYIKRKTLQKARLVVTANEYTSRMLRLKDSIVIKQGINTGRFREKRKKTNKKTTVAYAGHPSPVKGILEVIKAFKKLDPTKYEKNIFLSYKNKKIDRYANDQSINIYGYRKDIAEDYNNTDIMILPYRHDQGAIANPLVLLEAMACEKAIITTKLPHIKEICKDSVIYVKPYSSKQIIKAIKYLKENPEIRKALGKKARKRILEDYDEQQMFKKYERLYSRISSNQKNSSTINAQ